MSCSLWSIDTDSRHCTHEAGLVAYFDREITASGALRCMGPFGHESLSEAVVQQAMEDLSSLLERSLPNAYVVWGFYQDQADFLEHIFPILGGTCGFVPSTAIRGKINKSAWLAEWDLYPDHTLVHKSGLGSQEASRNVDLAVWHPKTIKAELQIMQVWLWEAFGKSINPACLQRGLEWSCELEAAEPINA